MKIIDIKNIDEKTGIKLEQDDTFKFKCHSQLECFNLCCRNLNLFLYPYDVIRLKNNLNITSDEFIEKYVDIVLRPSSFFPEVLLSMAENEEKTCPFLTNDGCSVYPDRPNTCRTFPVEQGMYYDEKQTKKLLHFFKPPDFCLGKNENTLWNYNTWIEDQDASLYNKMTIKWAEIRALFINNPWGDEKEGGARAKMAFMATYNIDSFREFIFSSTFLKKYKVKSELKRKIKKDDFALLTFGFSWIKFYLWGIKSNVIKIK
jgi:uncharacterized protein